MSQTTITARVDAKDKLKEEKGKVHELIEVDDK